MLKKKLINVFVIVIGIVFISTASYAKSNRSRSNEYHSWWFSPYYQIKKAVKDARTMKRKIVKLERKIRRLEDKKNKLEEKIQVLDEEVKLLAERPAVHNSEPTDEGKVKNEGEQKPFVCPGCNFSDSDEFIGHDFSNAFLGHMIAQNADMSNANFSKAKMRFSYIWDSSLQNANFTEADLLGAVLAGADFTGACFRDAKLEGVTWFEESYYGAATCPDGTLLEKDGDTTCIGHLEIENHCP